MSGPSFTEAARAAMRANEPQLASSALSAPRHSYASSYAREYSAAPILSYEEFKRRKVAELAQRGQERKAAPVAEDYSRPYSNPNRWRSTTQSTYTQQDTDTINPRLPDRPSKMSFREAQEKADARRKEQQEQESRTWGRPPPESHRADDHDYDSKHPDDSIDDIDFDSRPLSPSKSYQRPRPSTTASSTFVPAPHVPSLPLSRVDPDPHDARPEPTRTRYQERADEPENDGQQDEGARTRQYREYAGYDKYGDRYTRDDRDDRSWARASDREPERQWDDREPEQQRRGWVDESSIYPNDEYDHRRTGTGAADRTYDDAPRQTHRPVYEDDHGDRDYGSYPSRAGNDYGRDWRKDDRSYDDRRGRNEYEYDRQPYADAGRSKYDAAAPPPRRSAFSDDKYERDSDRSSPRAGYRPDYQNASAHHTNDDRSQSNYDRSYHGRENRDKDRDKGQDRGRDEADEVSQPVVPAPTRYQDKARTGFEDDDRSVEDVRRKLDGMDPYSRKQPPPSTSSSTFTQHPPPSSASSYTRPPSSHRPVPISSSSDVPAGRSTGIDLQSMRQRKHQPLWGDEASTASSTQQPPSSRTQPPPAPSAASSSGIFGPPPPSSSIRPAKRPVPSYDAYVEKLRREKPPTPSRTQYDADAAGARIVRGHVLSSARGSHLTSSGAVVAEDDDDDDPPQRTKRGLKWTPHSEAGRASIWDRDPILHRGSGYDQQQPPPPSSARTRLGLHPSMESEQVEAIRAKQRDTVTASRASTAASLLHHDSTMPAAGMQAETRPTGPRRGPQHLYEHTNIFAEMPRDDHRGSTRTDEGRYDDRPHSSSDHPYPSSPSRRRYPQSEWITRGSDHLASRNLLYDSKPTTSFFDRDREREQDRDDEARSTATAATVNDSTMSPRRSQTAIAGRSFHLSPDQQAERDAYEQQLRQLHEERQRQATMSSRSARSKKLRDIPGHSGSGYLSSRLW